MNNSQEITPILSKRPRSLFFEDYNDNLYEKIYGTPENQKKIKISYKNMINNEKANIIAEWRKSAETLLKDMPIQKPIEFETVSYNFIETYKTFINTQGNFLISTHKADNAVFNKYFEDIASLYHLVEGKGGYEEVTGLNQWDSFKNPAFDELLDASKRRSLKEFYQDYLFHYEKTHCSSHVIQTSLDNYNKTIERLDPGLLEGFQLIEDIDIYDENCLREVFKGKSCRFRGFLNGVVGFNNNMFSLEEISKCYGEQEVDSRCQNPDVYSFDILGKNSKQNKKMFTIKQYIKYQNDFNENQVVKDSNNVFFAVNIDISKWQNQLNELHKLPKMMFCQTQFDALTYLNQPIEGVTSPQLYLKVKGCWTGGHEENLRVQALNINHGPSDVEWYTIDNTNVPMLRTLILKTFSLDIHKSEGLWFSDADFLLENHIPVKKCIQKPGDIIYLNSGSLHWVRSRGVAVNSAWNIALKTLEVFSEMFNRLQINKEISFKSIIPIKYLILEVLKQDFKSLDHALLRYCLDKVENLIQEEFSLKKTLKFIKEPVDSNVLFCDICGEETFIYWIYCNNVACNAKYIEFFCINCIKSHEKNCKNGAGWEFYKKYEEKELENLISELKIFLKTGKLSEKAENRIEFHENDSQKSSEKKKICENDEEKYKIKKKYSDMEEDVKNFKDMLRGYYDKEEEIKVESPDSQERHKPSNILSMLISPSNK